MVYVALSRARNLRGLKVLRIARNMSQGVNREVQDFLTRHFSPAANPAPLPIPRRLPAPLDPWKQWRLACTAAFADYSSMAVFPAPPVAPCTRLECRTQPRLLEACQCNIRAAFARMEVQRMERSRWHPDKFARCPEGKREGFQRMAGEVFVVVDAMIREDVAKRAQGGGGAGV